MIHHVTHIRQLLVSTSVLPHCLKEHLDPLWSDLGPGLKLEFGRFFICQAGHVKCFIIDTFYAYRLTYRFFRECVQLWTWLTISDFRVISIIFILSLSVVANHSPSFKVVDGLFHSSLIVTHHVLMHAGVIAPYILLCTPVWDSAES